MKYAIELLTTTKIIILNRVKYRITQSADLIIFANLTNPSVVGTWAPDSAYSHIIKTVFDLVSEKSDKVELLEESKEIKVGGEVYVISKNYLHNGGETIQIFDCHGNILLRMYDKAIPSGLERIFYGLKFA